ncbi:hypothetical protein CJ030_MR7G000005 [Morella rubra]|uniref:Uncharacterized protein n=1 Tax=Morella rubra TaxID=262757 RepID=A0A6A1V1I0_9ROSI|nr:hypothetical protein CJ030_MR7G000005 [Morella rubra]
MKTSSATKYISVWLVALTFYLSAWSEAGCTEEQSGALLGIRDSTNGSAFADYDGNNCCGAKAIVCESGKVTGIYLESDSAPSGIWYPNVTSLTVFDDLEELILDGMNIGGTLQHNTCCSELLGRNTRGILLIL